jgi:hypothetical protein
MGKEKWIKWNYIKSKRNLKSAYQIYESLSYKSSAKITGRISLALGIAGQR